ncbi:hypothetical protein Dred_0806 [Desulforamulus reducens MI-1]|uniref:Uncharacterized protein n=1 Tax=Desulforamulus reducens (strain ATCC BAA-1160 / DSM 100696 / MI-1) TaxID=349161 RepID=A4J2P1_DESRM|nr:hypothetical protein [Desulforamulus reducens]ABO49344.1 hypothetical protein Dred_0806 [Desulforamulus reducens MI-1]
MDSFESWTTEYLLQDAIAGGVFVFIFLLAARFAVRAIIGSWFGRRNGALVSTIVEVFATFYFVIQASYNPGVYLGAVLAFSAGIMRHLIGNIRGL